MVDVYISKNGLARLFAIGSQVWLMSLFYYQEMSQCFEESSTSALSEIEFWFERISVKWVYDLFVPEAKEESWTS